MATEGGQLPLHGGGDVHRELKSVQGVPYLVAEDGARQVWLAYGFLIPGAGGTGHGAHHQLMDQLVIRELVTARMHKQDLRPHLPDEVDHGDLVIPRILRQPISCAQEMHTLGPQHLSSPACFLLTGGGQGCPIDRAATRFS